MIVVAAGPSATTSGPRSWTSTRYSYTCIYLSLSFSLSLSLCIYIYISCVYIYIYIYMYVYMYIYIYIYIYMWNYPVHRGLPGKLKSSNASRDNVSKEIGRKISAPRTSRPSRPCPCRHSSVHS